MVDLLRRLDMWLQEHRPNYYADLKPGLSHDQLDELQDDLGVELPESVRAFLAWRNGAPESFEGFFHNFQFLGSKNIVSAKDDLDEALESGEFEEENWWSAEWVPLFDNGAGDHVVLDTAGSFDGKAGQILIFYVDDDIRDIEFPSFEAMLSLFVEGLETELWWMEDGDIVVDDDGWDALREVRCPGYPIEASAG